MFTTRTALNPRDQLSGQVHPKSLRTAPMEPNQSESGSTLPRLGFPSALVCGYLTAIRAPVGRSNGKCRIKVL